MRIPFARCPAVFASFALLCTLLCGGGRGVAAQDLPWRAHQSWSTEEGLPQSSVHAILQSRDGFLWLATEGGAVRYDGVDFRVFRHDTDAAFTSDDVVALAEDRDGSLWVGTADGLIRLGNGASRRFDQNDGLPDPAITALATDAGGSVVVLAGERLVRFNGTRFEAVPGLEQPVRGLEQLRGGAIAILLGSGAIEQNPHGQAIRVAGTPELPGPLISVAESDAGQRWLATERGVALRPRTGNAPGRVWRVGTDLPGARVESLTLDHDGNAWVGTNRGLAVISRDGVVTRVPSLGAEGVLCSFQDREGDLWIGTEASGLHALRVRPFRTEPALAEDQVTTVAQTTDGAIWIGTRDDGIRRLRNHVAEQPIPTDALTSAVILSMAPGLTGDLWVGTPDGLSHIVGRQVQRFTSSDGLPDDFIDALHVAEDGTVWVGTRRGLAHLSSGRVDVLTEQQGLASNLVGVIIDLPARTAGSSAVSGLWVGTRGGVSHLEPGRLVTYGTAQGIPDDIVTGVAEDTAGTVWVASRHGALSRLVHGRFVTVRGSGLPDDLQAMTADHFGALWLRSRRGIARVTVASLTDCGAGPRCTPDVTTYGTLDGMPNDELAGEGRPALWQMRSGELWCGTRKGVAITDPGHLPRNRVPPPVVIEAFLVDDHPEPDSVDLPFGHGRYTFRYAGLSLVNPAEVRYSYRLEGFDQDWIAAGAQRSASYTNLSPKQYRFLVRAANNDGVWSTSEAIVRFSVRPPFYRRWWFFLLVLLAAAAIASLLYLARVRRLQRQFAAVLAERNRMAREIHDTLAQDFVGISLRLEIIAQLLRREQLQQAAEQVQGTRELVKTGLAAARQSIWDLRANTARDSLPTRLSELVNRYAAPNRAANVTIGGAYRKLEREIEDEVLRIAQEALSNADRHSQAKAVTVDLRYDHDRLHLRISDNGRGFSVAEATAMQGHFGLRGLYERAATLGADLRIESAEAAGTVVTLAVPIPPPGRLAV